MQIKPDAIAQIPPKKANHTAVVPLLMQMKGLFAPRFASVKEYTNDKTKNTLLDVVP